MVCRCPSDESLGYSRSSLAGLDLWKSSADFETQTRTKLGFRLARETEGSSRLEVYFELDVDGNSRVLFWTG